MKCWAMLMMLSLMSAIIAPIVFINAKDEKCQVQDMSSLLGVDKDAYLLYGINTDCRIFFAMYVPDTDLAKELNNPADEKDLKNCLYAKMQPMIDEKGQMHLVITKKTDSKYKVVEFQLPSKDNWLIKSNDAVDDMNCADCGVMNISSSTTAVIKGDGFMLRDLQQLILPTKLKGKDLIMSSYQLQQDGKQISADKNDEFKMPPDVAPYRMVDDPNAKHKYIFYQDDNLVLSMQKWTEEHPVWIKTAVDYNKLFSIQNQPYIINSRMLAMQNEKINISRINEHLNSNSTEDDLIMNTTCIGQFDIKNKNNGNFQMSALLLTFFDKMIEQNTATTSTMASNDATASGEVSMGNETKKMAGKEEGEDGGLGTAAIVGIVMGVLAAAVVAAVLVWCCLWGPLKGRFCGKKPPPEEPPKEAPLPHPHMPKSPPAHMIRKAKTPFPIDDDSDLSTQISWTDVELGRPLTMVKEHNVTLEPVTGKEEEDVGIPDKALPMTWAKTHICLNMGVEVEKWID